MASSMSSLGLGSDGALSYDVIDKLRGVDEKAIIAPIDNKISKNQTKTNDLSALTTLTASLKAETSTLSDEMSYLKRTTSSSNDGISVDVSSGTEIQDFTFDVTAMAKRDINESKSFAKTTDTFASEDDTVNFNIDGKDYKIDISAATTIEQFKNKIYDATDGKITASLLNVGGTDPYKLILKSTDTGANNAITVTTADTTDLGITNIQKAGDLDAKFNGVQISRSSNKIDDLIVGVTINANAEVSSNISIKQDTSTISDSLSSFVSKYNDLMSNLVESTKYNSDTKAAGTFQGTSEIKSLKSDISKSLLTVDSSGKSLSEYGVTLNDAGILEFDQSAFDSKMSSNSSDAENFFRGDSTTDGFFTNFNSLLSGYIDSSNGILTRYDTQLTNEKKTLEESKITATKRLDSKYNIMAKKFAAYDTVISQYNASFQSLSMQISSMVNGTN